MPDFAAATQTVRDRFITQFHDQRPGVPIQPPNRTRLLRGDDTVAQKPPDDAAWVRLTIQGGPARQVSIAEAAAYRQSGTAVVQVFVPMGSGDDTAMAIADEVAAIFRGVIDSGVRFGAPRIEDAGEARHWHQINIATPFSFDTTV